MLCVDDTLYEDVLMSWKYKTHVVVKTTFP